MRCFQALVLVLLVGCEGDARDQGGIDIDIEGGADADADGYAAKVDCDDQDPAVHPGAAERCDGADNDCDTATDEQAVDAPTWYGDLDGDGAAGHLLVRAACDPPEGYASAATDCDDLDGANHPGGTEVCDGRDNDCSGEPDEDAVDPGTWYADTDGDHFGDGEASVVACVAPAGHVANPDDCDDAVTWVHPGTAEACDAIDRDCDGDPVAGALDTETFYRDSDGDGHGDAAVVEHACAPSDGFVTGSLDCDDGDGTVHPDASEDCATVDRDCDGDPTAGAVDAPLWFPDGDDDGYGDPAAGTRSCVQPEGSFAEGLDCHDDQADAFPGSTALETPLDGIDTDCDGVDACTDLNCDGLPDVMLTCLQDGDYTCSAHNVLTGPGGLTSGPELPQYGTMGATAADLDKDGYQDLVYAFYHDGSTYNFDSVILWGSADGYSWEDRTGLATHGARGVAVGDLDRDDWPDVLFCNFHDGVGWDDDPSYVYWSDEGTFSAERRAALDGYAAFNCKIVDVDADGFLDVIVPGNNDGDDTAPTFIYWGSRGGVSNDDRSEVPGASTHDVDVADLDEDGHHDLVLTNYYRNGNHSTDSWVYWGSASGWSVDDRTSLPTHGARWAEVADFDEDGWLDIAFANNNDEDALVDSYVYWGSAEGFSTTDRTGLPTRGAHHLRAVDLDLDGWLDLVFVNHYGSWEEHDSYIYWGSAAGFSEDDRSGVPTLGATYVDVADTNHDGWPDLLFAGYHIGGSWANQTYSYLYYGGPSGYAADRGETFTQWGAWYAQFVGR